MSEKNGKKESKPVEEEDMFKADIEETTQIQFFDIYPIQMMIQHNIPNKKPFVLKSSSFVIDPAQKKTEYTYTELPFFTNEYEYPINYLIKLEPFEIMDFFFVREEFELKLRKYIIKSGKTTDTNKKENSKKNANYMLQLLFKTVYPRVNNISNSFNEFVLNTSSQTDINIYASLKPEYTYVKDSGKTYTILKVVLLDDIFNNDIYRQLFDAYFEYATWCTKEKKRIEREYDVNYKKIVKTISNYKNYDNDINIITQRIKGIEDNAAKTTIIGANSDELLKLSDLKTLLSMFTMLKYYKELIAVSKDPTEIQKIKAKINNVFNQTQQGQTVQTKEPKDILYDNILDQLQTILSSTGLRFDRNTNAFVTTLTQNYNIGKDSKILSDTFLKNNTIDINIPMEKYTGYTKFINTIKKYLSPQRITSNTDLQEIIDDYANNQFTDEQPTFVKFANLLYGCFDKYNPVCKILKPKRPIVDKYVETDICEINVNTEEHKYEIYVHLDVIEGKLDPKNTNQITCSYQDSRLANQFAILTNRKKHGSWILLPGPFMVLSSEIGKNPVVKPSRLSKINDYFDKFTDRFTRAKTKTGGKKTKPCRKTKKNYYY